jgi:S1-C subfamily serine protease
MPGTQADVNRPASPSVGRGVNTPGPHRTGIPVSFTRPEYPADPYAHDLTGARGGTRPGPDSTGDPEPAESAGSRSAPSGIAGWRWAIAAGGVAVVAILVIAVLAFRLGAGSGSGAASGGTAGATTSASPTTATTLPVTDVYGLVQPSVVLITTSKGAVGSGVVVTDTGTVLTANHVVSGGGTIKITFADGTTSAATVATADRTTDMAMLMPSTLPEVVVPATLGGGVAVGSDVVAIGNPLGLVDSTTSGIVSGIGRTAKTDAGTFTGLIQFDAAVNPGSSGGPLLDDKGLVVGIVVSIADPGEDDSFAGIGFAVPIAAAVGGGGSGQGPGGGPQI